MLDAQSTMKVTNNTMVKTQFIKSQKYIEHPFFFFLLLRTQEQPVSQTNSNSLTEGRIFFCYLPILTSKKILKYWNLQVNTISVSVNHARVSKRTEKQVGSQINSQYVRLSAAYFSVIYNWF